MSGRRRVENRYEIPISGYRMRKRHSAVTGRAVVALPGICLAAAMLPSSILIKLALCAVAFEAMRLALPWVRGWHRLSPTIECRTVVAMLSGNLAALGGILYMAALGISRLLMWGVAHKLSALVSAAALAGLVTQFDIDWLWLVEHASELEANVPVRNFPLIP